MTMSKLLVLTPSAAWLKRCMTVGLAVCALAVQAQGLIDNPDWKETEVPAPPAFSKDHLIAIEMPPYVTLKFGVDPATLAITADGIVRYVMLATNASGSVNAMYEGIRCATGEVKTYARASNSGAWSVVKEPLWRDFSDNLPSKHAIAFARQGACDGRAAAASSVADIIKNLKR
jgi:hypothetical protein